jgi:beta-phosphoglucomutase
MHSASLLRQKIPTKAIEDTPAGIISAKGAGLKVLAVTNSYDRDYLLEADAVADSLENVTRALLENVVF